MDKWYQPPNRSLWHGRIDGGDSKRFHEIVICERPECKELIPYSYGLLGFACDEGVKRNLGCPGAKEGPTAFRQSFSKIPTSLEQFYDFGDVICEDQDLESSQKTLGHIVSKLYAKKIFPIVIGGGHEVAWGHYLGIKEHFSKCAVLNIDAHFDLRPLLENQKGSSGTPFTQIANDSGRSFDYYCIGIQELSNTKQLFNEAQKRNVHYLFAHEIDGKKESDFINEILRKHHQIYLTICMDVFAAPFAPGVSAPQPLGLLPQAVLPMLKKLAASGKVIAFNLAEISPPSDRDELTSSLAALLTASFIKEVAKF